MSNRQTIPPTTLVGMGTLRGVQPSGDPDFHRILQQRTTQPLSQTSIVKTELQARHDYPCAYIAVAEFVADGFPNDSKPPIGMVEFERGGVISLFESKFTISGTSSSSNQRMEPIMNGICPNSKLWFKHTPNRKILYGGQMVSLKEHLSIVTLEKFLVGSAIKCLIAVVDNKFIVVANRKSAMSSILGTSPWFHLQGLSSFVQAPATALALQVLRVNFASGKEGALVAHQKASDSCPGTWQKSSSGNPNIWVVTRCGGKERIDIRWEAIVNINVAELKCSATRLALVDVVLKDGKIRHDDVFLSRIGLVLENESNKNIKSWLQSALWLPYTGSENIALTVMTDNQLNRIFDKKTKSFYGTPVASSSIALVVAALRPVIPTQPLQFPRLLLQPPKLPAKQAPQPNRPTEKRSAPQTFSSQLIRSPVRTIAASVAVAKKPAVVEIPDDDDDQVHQAQYKSRKRRKSENEDEILFLYPFSAPEDTITIRLRDLDCCKVPNYLNDSVIDFYAKWWMLENAKSDITQLDCPLMSSFFFTRMDWVYSKLSLNRASRRKAMKASSSSASPAVPSSPLKDYSPTLASVRFDAYQRVRTWTRGMDIFTKSLLIIPINKGHHWSVCLIRFRPVKSSSGPPSVDDVPPNVTIYTLDSLPGMHDAAYIGDLVISYLEHEWFARNRTLLNNQPWPIPVRAGAADDEERLKHQMRIAAEGADAEDEDDMCEIVDGPSGPASTSSEDRFTLSREDCVFTSEKCKVRILTSPEQADGFNCGVYALKNMSEVMEIYPKLKEKASSPVEFDQMFVQHFENLKFTRRDCQDLRGHVEKKLQKFKLDYLEYCTGLIAQQALANEKASASRVVKASKAAEEKEEAAAAVAPQNDEKL